MNNSFSWQPAPHYHHGLDIKTFIDLGLDRGDYRSVIVAAGLQKGIITSIHRIMDGSFMAVVQDGSGGIAQVQIVKDHEFGMTDYRSSKLPPLNIRVTNETNQHQSSPITPASR